MIRALSSLLVVGVLCACGPSPAAATAEPPSGTLIVMIKQGPERVPFHPKVARIQRANQQLAAILGHSIEIELDGSLLPQTHEGAEDVIARLVEDVARDLDALGKEDKKALEFARAKFERLVVRYAPAEAAAREERWQRRQIGAKLDPSSKTIDVVRAEASWRALDRGEITTVIYRAFSAGNDERYARVLPDALPRGEQRNWFEYHAHGGGHSVRSQDTKEDPYSHLGSLDARRLRGMVILHGLATQANDAELVKDVRKWLVHAVSDLSSTYHHHQAEVEGAPASSSFRQAETAYVGWLRAELPRMTNDERGELAAHLWVTDFRKPNGDRDRFATYAFPGIDPMAFSFDAIDAWVAAGQPSKSEPREPHPYFETVVCPATVENKSGELRFSTAGRCDGTFYRWALANRTREDALVKGVVARGGAPLAAALFYNAHRVLRDEGEYLRFLRRFEASPALWKVGADVQREGVFRPSEALLEESRRLWREVPTSRGHALFWFARHGEGSYHPDSDWPDMVQGTPADDNVLGAYLDIGWPAFELLPSAWPGVAKSSGRIRVVTAHAKTLLGGDISTRGGTVAGTLARLARTLCEEGSMLEVAELRAFAQSELPSRPGQGLSNVIEATEPAQCKPKHRARPPTAKPRKVVPRAVDPKGNDANGNFVDPFGHR